MGHELTPSMQRLRAGGVARAIACRADLGRNGEAEGLMRGRVYSSYHLLDRSDDFLDRVGTRYPPGFGIIRRDQFDRAGLLGG